MRHARERAQPAQRELFDPYAPLDPHDAGCLPQKPFKKMKPRRCAQSRQKSFLNGTPLQPTATATSCNSIEHCKGLFGKPCAGPWVRYSSGA